MSSELDAAADTVLELTNTLGATAASLQNSQQTMRTLRRIATVAARRPGYVALTGLGLLALSAVLALRGAGETAGPAV